ncbi:MAG TPA: hypothetical protein VFL38_00745 [Humibacillus xanthopallidus]|nr:hypothetical protein [Humibacillus xanthopallidus]
MTIDILALDTLPETEPTALADLDGQGLLPCSQTCWFWTCLYTCKVTEA